MFGISAKGQYGVSAMLELARKYQHGAVQIKEIADSRNIPQHYLEQILVVLKRGGLVKSVRGAQGGYMLALPPEKITLLDVLTLLEGEVEVVPKDRYDDQLQGIWMNLTNILQEFLGRNLNEVLEKIRFDSSCLNYTI